MTGKGMWPAVLPWNTTRTMADVWAEAIASQRRAWREQSYRRAKPESHSARAKSAGFDATERH